MKIRNGFVSNSSSSSFIVSMDNYDDSIELALHMVPQRDWMKLVESCDLMTDEQLVNTIEARAIENEFIGKNVNIMIRTTNYETLIRPFPASNCFVVDTCNNHDWNNIPKATMMPEELKRMNLAANTWYWDPETDLWIRPLYDYPLDQQCNHYVRYEIKNATEDLSNIYCPLCFSKCHPDYTIGGQIHAAKRREEIKKLPEFFNIWVDKSI